MTRTNLGASAPALPELITKAQVALILGRSSSGVDKLRVRDPDFPKPLKSSDNRRSRVYFVRSEIESYLQGKLDERAAA